MASQQPVMVSSKTTRHGIIMKCSVFDIIVPLFVHHLTINGFPNIQLSRQPFFFKKVTLQTITQYTKLIFNILQTECNMQNTGVYTYILMQYFGFGQPHFFFLCFCQTMYILTMCTCCGVIPFTTLLTIQLTICFCSKLRLAFSTST